MSESMTGGRAVGAGQGWAWIADGFGLFKKAPGIWIALVVILFVILIVLAFIPLLGAVATFLLMPVFIGGLILGCRALQGGGELEMGHLFAGFDKAHAGNLIVLGALAIGGWIIVMLPVVAIVGAGAVVGLIRGDVAGVAAMGGSLMLAWLVALALSIPIYMALWFAPALVVLRRMAPVAAIRESFLGCLKNIVPFLVYSIVFLVLGIVASIPLGLGWLVLGPVTVASVYTAYRDIFGDA
ncbi:MAG TPA: BPSS1780 family membrane protein [Burkholderiales bacterium]|jgi:hypothetical protein